MICHSNELFRYKYRFFLLILNLAKNDNNQVITVKMNSNKRNFYSEHRHSIENRNKIWNNDNSFRAFLK